MVATRNRRLAEYGIAVLAVAVAVAARLLLAPLLGEGVPFILFFPTVMLASRFGGLWPGLATTALAALAAYVFFMEPAYTISFKGSDEIVRLALFVAGGVFISWMGGGLRAATEQARERLAREHTAREEAEEAGANLRRIVEELARSNRDLEQFAYVASHDLQEPLRAVSGCVQILQRRYAGQMDGRADELITHTVDGVGRMQNLIHDLLAFSRVGTRAAAPAPVVMQDALYAALANLRAAIDGSDTVVTHDDLPVVDADATQIIQLLQNLIANAIKFRGDAPPRVHVGVRARGDEWEFSVTDNGIGIEPEYFDRIFIIFQRLHTREQYSGTGMGLAICKKIVERHGGRIWLESEPGEGSTFRFTLPRR